VIATGFKADGIKSPHERERVMSAAAGAISTERAASAFIPSAPKPAFKPQTTSMMTSSTSTTLRETTPTREAATHETVRPQVHMSADEVDDLGLEDLLEGAVMAVEWPDRWRHPPIAARSIAIEPVGETSRRIITDALKIGRPEGLPYEEL